MLIIILVLLRHLIVFGTIFYAIAYCMFLWQRCFGECDKPSDSEIRERRAVEGRRKILEYHRNRPYHYESHEYVRMHKHDDGGGWMDL